MRKRAQSPYSEMIAELNKHIETEIRDAQLSEAIAEFSTVRIAGLQAKQWNIEDKEKDA
jgi:hypothetical protein